jgi:hypothetical protein
MSRIAMAIVLAATLAASRTQPRAVIAGSQLEVFLPAATLDDARLSKLLSSGLTTAIVVGVDEKTSRGTKIRGNARIEIRDDLWNEVYYVTLYEGGKRSEQKLAAAKLRDWWSSTPVRLASLPDDAPPPSVRITLQVIPFSAREEAEAQRWLLHSMRDGASPRAASGPQLPAGAVPANGVFDRFIATSVQRRPVLAWNWTVPLTRP